MLSEADLVTTTAYLELVRFSQRHLHRAGGLEGLYCLQGICHIGIKIGTAAFVYAGGLYGSVRRIGHDQFDFSGTVALVSDLGRSVFPTHSRL